MSNESLLPCPFCGKEAILDSDGSGSGKYGMQVCRTYYYIVCTFCNIKTSYDRSKQVAIKLWNKRHDSLHRESWKDAFNLGMEKGTAKADEKLDKALAIIHKLVNCLDGDYTLRDLIIEARELLKELNDA